MAANGEERLLTLFADVHYYFGLPGPRPVNHRFDKESYLYLYRDAAQRRGRIEIANHAGTPEQDAFTGYLDNSKIVQSNKHPALVTVTVDAFKPSASAPAQPNEHHWRLPSTDPRDEGKYLFRLHTLDLYFWTVEDAYSFLQNAQQTLRAEQLNVDAIATPAHHGESMSPVVQQLENVAISDPAYMNGKTRDSRATSTTKAGSSSSPAPSTQTTHTSREEARNEQDPAAFTPLAYNPAAPPAPEEHKHREKTPPPPEANVIGTGLAAAAYNDHLHSQQRQAGSLSAAPQGYPSIGQSPYSGTSPASVPYGSPQPLHGGVVSSPAPGLQQPSSGHRPPNAGSSYFPGPPSAASPANPAQRASPAAPPYSPGDPNAHLYPQNNKPLDSPNTQILGASYSAGRGQPLQHLQPQYANYLSTHPSQQQQPGQPRPSGQGSTPLGGFSSYNYDQEPNQHHHHHHSSGGSAGNPYATGDTSIHTQVYRPTEDEAQGYGLNKPSGRHGSTASGGTGAGPGQQPGKLEEKALKAEKGINKLLRKVEKKIG